MSFRVLSKDSERFRKATRQRGNSKGKISFLKYLAKEFEQINLYWLAKIFLKVQKMTFEVLCIKFLARYPSKKASLS